ncbi:4139_t:CDS:2, partial [Gigaspora margarita]
ERAANWLSWNIAYGNQVLVKSGESVKNLVIIRDIKPRKRGLEFQQSGQHNGIL